MENSTMSIGNKFIVCSFTLIVLLGSAWWIFVFSPMNIDAVKKEIVASLKLDVNKVQYICGGRHGCKTIAFEYTGNDERFIQELNAIGMVVFTSQADKDYYTRRLMLLGNQSKLIKDIDRKSTDLHIYDVNGFRIYEFKGRYLIVVSY